MNIFKAIKNLTFKPTKTEEEYKADFKKLHQNFKKTGEIVPQEMREAIEGLISYGWTQPQTLKYTQEMDQEKQYETDEDTNIITLH